MSREGSFEETWSERTYLLLSTKNSGIKIWIGNFLKIPWTLKWITIFEDEIISQISSLLRFWMVCRNFIDSWSKTTGPNRIHCIAFSLFKIYFRTKYYTLCYSTTTALHFYLFCKIYSWKILYTNIAYDLGCNIFNMINPILECVAKTTNMYTTLCKKW